MTHKFQKYDPVFRRINLGEGNIKWEKAGTISGTLNKATDNDRPLYHVKGQDGHLRTIHEDQLKHASDVQHHHNAPEFKPGVMV